MQPWPACWKREQWIYFSKENDWLSCSEEKLGCKVCTDVGSLGTHRFVKGQKTQLSKEWTSCFITPYGDNDENQLASLRKKVHGHKLSSSHIEAGRVKVVSNSNILPEAIIETEKELLHTTCRIFRMGYYVTKNDEPYVDHSELVDLQRVNGCDVGRILHSKTVCTDITDHVSQEMRKKLIANIVLLERPFSVLINEITSLGKK